MLERAIISDNSVNPNSGLGSQMPDAQLIVLKSAYSSCETRYQFEIRSDGTGRIIYPDSFSDSEDFFHEIDLAVVVKEIEESVAAVYEFQSDVNLPQTSEIESIRREITTEKLEELFWEEINQTLEDPFYRSFEDESEWGSEFCCETGSVEELEEFLGLCVLSEKEISDPDDYLVFNSGTECEGAGISDCSYTSERLIELVEIACEHFRPAGYTYDYNDGWGDRYSGYSMNSETISISLKESALTPARKKMLAMVKLRQKLSEMKISPEKIAELTSF